MSFGRALTGGVAAAWALGLALGTPASAVVVYQRSGDPQTYPYNSRVFAASNDGTASRRIARGYWPQISHDGRRVAYFVASRSRGVDDLYTVGVRGRHRRLVVRDVSSQGGIAWSPDDRYVVVGSGYSYGILLVDVRRRVSHEIQTGDFGGASFAPDGGRFAVENEPASHGASWLTMVDVRSHHQHPLSGGEYGPVWGPPGLAFAHDNDPYDPEDPAFQQHPPPPDTSVLLRESWGGHLRTLLHERADLRPIDWSANGHRLLIAELRPRLGEDALVLQLKARALRRIPCWLSAIDELSKNGREVLGEAEGAVVGLGWDGKAKVLARDATHASWTK